LVKFGASLPTCCEGLLYPIPFADVSGIIKIAKAAEELGFDSVWGNDHVTVQKYVRERWGKAPNYYEPLTVLSVVGSVTKKIRIATGIIVLPLREPVILAKQVATLDQYSAGRFILGVGLGAYREEFEAVFPTMRGANRGAILDEKLKALRLLFEKPVATFSGKFVNFKNVELFPKPLQKPMPIYIGGNSSNDVRRAAELCNGWFPAVLSPEEIRTSIARMKDIGDKAGRKVSEIDIAPQLVISIGKTHEEAEKAFKRSGLYTHLLSLKDSTLKNQIANLEARSIIGTPDETIRRMEEYIDAGVTHFGSLIFGGDTVDAVLDSMKSFAKEIMPSFR